MEQLLCKLCHGPCAFLGTLGRLDWFRCINCGMDFHLDHQVEEFEEPIQEEEK